MFVSYAQNFEDVLLWRALKHVAQGFYIDVGANDPTIDSVTKAFYDRGWRGINIEPIQSHHADLTRERQRDINLMCAAGPRPGELEIFECDVRGWATADRSVIERHMQDGHAGTYCRVPMVTLAEICRRHAPGEIHFLKVDVEGYEALVLEGMDFDAFRPWIVVVEATRPNSPEEAHEQWEHLVLQRQYRFAYADGLNRYYVSDEHSELVTAFRYPPNVFDQFVSASQAKAQASVRLAETQTNLARAQLAAAKARAQTAEARTRLTESRALEIERSAQAAEGRARLAESHALEIERGAQAVGARAEHEASRAADAKARNVKLKASFSWRLTRPLRKLGKLSRKLIKRSDT